MAAQPRIRHSSQPWRSRHCREPRGPCVDGKRWPCAGLDGRAQECPLRRNARAPSSSSSTPTRALRERLPVALRGIGGRLRRRRRPLVILHVKISTSDHPRPEPWPVTNWVQMAPPIARRLLAEMRGFWGLGKTTGQNSALQFAESAGNMAQVRK